MQTLLNADCRLYVYLHGTLRSRRVDPLMVAFTHAGTKGMIWFALAGLLLLVRADGAPVAAAASLTALLIAEGVINFAVKPLVRRERPYRRGIARRVLVREPGSNSLPSAHAGSSLAAGAVLTVMYWPWGAGFLALALVVAYSRVYVGVHYPLDVVVGALVGMAAAVAVLICFALVGLMPS